MLQEVNEVDRLVEGQDNDAGGGIANEERAEGMEEVDAPAQNNGVQGQVQNDDVNWNLMEWDRAEELTWERLLGLDGSLVFLEHVFWVASLNTLFILVFGNRLLSFLSISTFQSDYFLLLAFCPYHIGHFAIVGFKMKDWVSACHFEGLLTTLCGYVIIGLFLVLLHGVTSLLHLRK